MLQAHNSLPSRLAVVRAKRGQLLAAEAGLCSQQLLPFSPPRVLPSPLSVRDRSLMALKITLMFDLVENNVSHLMG